MKTGMRTTGNGQRIGDTRYQAFDPREKELPTGGFFDLWANVGVYLFNLVNK